MFFDSFMSPPYVDVHPQLGANARTPHSSASALAQPLDAFTQNGHGVTELVDIAVGSLA